MDLIDELSNTIDDAAWRDNVLYTIREQGTNNTELQSWFQTFNLNMTWTIPGTPLRLFNVGDKLFSVTMMGGIPQFNEVPIRIVTPSGGMNVFRGNLIAGSNDDLLESDDVRAIIRPGFVLSSDEAPVWLVFNSQLPQNNPLGLFLDIESHTNTPNLTMTVESFNFNTGSFDVVGSEDAAFNVDAIFTCDLTDGISDYVANDQVLARVGWRQTGFTFIFPWDIRVDQVAWVIE